jgi:hypothetical protein
MRVNTNKLQLKYTRGQMMANFKYLRRVAGVLYFALSFPVHVECRYIFHSCINSTAISKNLFLLEICKNKRIICTFAKFDLNKWPRETHVDLSFKTMLEVFDSLMGCDLANICAKGKRYK